MPPPGLHVVTAPALEPLLERLVDTLQRDPLPPTEAETIVIARNAGMRAWLTHALAQRLGCAASLDLPAPVSLVAKLAGISGGMQPYEAGPLSWRLRPLLDAIHEGREADPVFAPLRAYLGRTGGRAMPLATRIAELFDTYQVYRPDVLHAWAQGEDPHPAFAHGPWQAALWRRIHTDAPTFRDRATAFATLERRLAEPEPNLPLPDRLSVFSALLFPPAYYRVIAGIARHRPVTLYAVTAGREATTEPHAHPLLRALGGRTRDYWHVLRDLGAPSPERLSSLHLGAEAGASSALWRLQAALANDEPPTAPTPLTEDDRSLRIHDCHSPTRELEALRDTILDAFAEIDGLRPADVLVIVPDLDTYAPLVDAVFGAEDAAPELRIPYHVAEHPHAPALRVVEAFLRALRLHEGRVTASDLLDLLGTPVVRRAAGIGEEELPRLRAWIRESGVCWGLTAERKTRFDLPEDDLHTWRFGLDRLLLGVITGGSPKGDLVLGHLPCDIAGLGGADLLGRFCEWAEALFSGLDALDRPAPLDAWPARLVQFLDGVFRAETDEEIEAVVFLRQQAQQLAELNGLADHPGEAVSFRTVRAHLDGAAGALETREPYVTGRVTVAQPLTLRHAPHRVVAFVGLNDGVWPRPDLAPDFDLLAHDPRPGDPDPRGLDKQLFVDAVLAARDRLILSYVGRSQKDNAERAASVCLDAFRDAARRHFGPEADRLAVEHRLQPFASDYFSREGPLASYAAQHRVNPGDEPTAFFEGDTLPDEQPPTEIPLHELVRAWTDPSRYLLRDRLRLSLDLDDSSVQDDEPVVLSGLEKWRVREQVLAALLDGLDDDTIAERLMRSGLLPAGEGGAAWLRSLRQSVEPVRDAVLDWGHTDPLAVSVPVEGGLVTGIVERVGERGGLRFRAGSVREKDLVAAWVDHLAMCAFHPLYTCTVGVSGEAHFEPLGREDAKHFLQALVRGYGVIRTTLPPLFEKASHTYADKLGTAKQKAWADRILAREQQASGTGDGSHNGVPGLNDWAMGQARKSYEGGFGVRGDTAEAHVALATRGRDPFGQEAADTHRWAMCLWGPLLAHRQTGCP
ncbi:MAG: exodeoxyribonuclease V subunit gamma [Bacteroidota bacterium]